MIIEDHWSLMEIEFKNFKVEKVECRQISKSKNFYVGKSLSPKS